MTNQYNKSFIIHKDSLLILNELSDDEAGKLFKAIFHYQTFGNIEKIDQLTKIALNPFLNQFKRDQEKWEEECKRSSEKGKLGNLKRWHPNLYSQVEKGELSFDNAQSILKDRPPIPPDPTRSLRIPGSLDSDSDSDSDNKNNKKKEISSDISKKKNFQKPILEEIKTYCLERKNNIDPEKWLDYYESNGWKVGKNPMKDWKAVIRNWERNSNSGNKSENHSNSLEDNLNQILGQNIVLKVTEKGGELIILMSGGESYERWTKTSENVKKTALNLCSNKFNGLQPIVKY